VSTQWTFYQILAICETPQSVDAGKQKQQRQTIFEYLPRVTPDRTNAFRQIQQFAVFQTKTLQISVKWSTDGFVMFQLMDAGRVVAVSEQEQTSSTLYKLGTAVAWLVVLV